MEREKFGSRLGFVLISAGCAIGLGNVWRFPYIVGQYGGAAFILVYLLFLVVFGLPIMTMEFAVGRASQKSVAESFRALEPAKTKWHHFGWVGMAGNFLLMMFYTVVTGWMFIYFVKMIKGDFSGTLSSEAIGSQFGEMVSNPYLLIGVMACVTIVGFLICSFGLKNGVERVNKIMMLCLLVIIAVLAVYVLTLPGAGAGVKYYLVPDFSKFSGRVGEVLFAAMGQAFFTLSIGMGSMAIFGSYIKKDRRLLGESVSIAALDTFVAFMAGLIVIPACFAFGVAPEGGPDLIFKALPNVFNAMPGGRVWGSLFFLFMIFAAMSTVTAVFENIISITMEKFGWTRKQACIYDAILVIVLSIPCALGFNVLAGFTPLGGTSCVLDLEDFIVSNNILPIGSLIYLLFCTLNKDKGWGYDNFLTEANTGKGLAVPKGKWFKVYVKYVLPLIIIFLWVYGYISTFFL